MNLWTQLAQELLNANLTIRQKKRILLKLSEMRVRYGNDPDVGAEFMIRKTLGLMNRSENE